ncbi:MAG: hypothetical protein WA431_12520 [Candidatus Cybelea sp.]
MRLSSAHAVSIIASLLLLAGCGQPQGVLSPQAAPPALTQQVPRRTGEVQYFSNYYGSYLTEFDYPKGDSQIGQLNFSGGMCTKGARTFWVVGSAPDQVQEFKANGKAPIKTRIVTAGQPTSCAVDTTTGNLAVTILSNGDVEIFKPGSNSGTTLSSGLNEAFFDGYDGNGNLFADGLSSSGGFQLVELPKGSSRFEDISISSAITFPNGVQWDGTYLTMGCTGGICRYRIIGRKAILKGIVPVSDCAGYWIERPYVYCADLGNDDGEVFKYPAGGSPIASLTGSFDNPLGVVSLRVR